MHPAASLSNPTPPPCSGLRSGTCKRGYGDLDLVMRPAGTAGYKDLDRDAQTIKLGRVQVRIASLADVIRSKEAAGREKDRATLPALRRLLDELSR